MSRRHAKVSFDGSRFWVSDLGSQNGTSCDGRPIVPNQPTEVSRVLRLGDSLFVVSRNIAPFAERGVRVDGGQVLGPALQGLLAEVRQAAKFGSALHITGESGTGKELAARAFHEQGPRRAHSFVPVNCAAIPNGLAERLLFGARRGAYSGADANAEGYIQAAAGGTLFLDEVGDLDLNVQAKLLRVLETKELLPLGASRAHSVELNLCSATNRDLKTLAASGRFREDLYYRIGRPMVALPSLRKRPEEIPWLIAAAVQQVAAELVLHPSLIETCLLRPWPGNIRELLVEVRSAAQTASVQSPQRVESRHLPDGAGTALRALGDPSSIELLRDATPTPPPSPGASKPPDSHERARLELALRSHQGNVSSAARSLGLHRTQLRRLLERHGLDPQQYVVSDRPPPPSDKQLLDPDEL
jgi:transcriptional regulator with GAF, ATPase, and Fis domain